MHQLKKGLLGILFGCCVLSLTACSPQKYIDKILGTEKADEEESVQEEVTQEEPEVPVAKPEFTANLSGSMTYGLHQGATPLKVEASVSDSGTLTYQWYRNMTNTNGGGTIIEGATDDTYTPPTDQPGTYYYYVVATNTVQDSTEGTTSETAEVIVNDEEGDVVNAEAGQWKQDDKGWWFENADGSFIKSQWKEIQGKWYAFDENGYIRTGWFQDGDSWYYLNEDGSMAADKDVEGYHLGSDGKME
ncbi:hypothetical protein [Lactonifactor longoviformis]|uniref:hypothetical protein n=1 Tax=Lactonifactor longoviformis TaxID=341220 RepID=UPI0036F3E215